MLAAYRPAKNSRLDWTLSRVQEVLHCSRTIASESLTDLEKNGWLAVCRVGRFSGSRQPSLYRLTMFASEVEDLPKTEEFLRVRNPPRSGRKKNLTGSNKTVSKSLLEPRQVLVETAAAENRAKIEDSENPPKARKHRVFEQKTEPTPTALGNLASQLLSTSALASLRANEGIGVGREARRSATPPHAPTSGRARLASNKRKL